MPSKKDATTMPDSKTNKISRRRMLSVIAGSACYAARTGTTQAATPVNLGHLHKAATAGLKVTTTGIFNKHEMEAIAALSEIIIPADSHSAGARAAGVDQYINETVAASEEPSKRLWIDGLAAIDGLAKIECGKTFADCSADQQADLITRISQNEDNPVTLEEQFFLAVKQSTVEGYYSSDIGIHQDLQYQGNAVLVEFPGCNHEEHKAGRKGKV